MLEDMKPTKRVYICKVLSIANSLSDTDRDILLAAADDVAWGCKTLEKELGKRGITLADTTIAKHRNKLCTCYR